MLVAVIFGILMALVVSVSIVDGLRGQRDVAIRTLDARDETIADLRVQVDYWRTRAEKLTDAALARTGAINAPTMVDPPKERPTDMASLITGAMATTEIDSSRGKSPSFINTALGR